MMRAKTFLLGAAACVFAVFPLAFVWHLVVLRSTYDRLGYFKGEPIVWLGFVTIVVQGLVLSYLFPFFQGGSHWATEGLKFGLLMGLFLWSSQVVAAAAKRHVTSIGEWLAVESAYFVIQFALVGLALGLVYKRGSAPGSVAG